MRFCGISIRHLYIRIGIKRTSKEYFVPAATTIIYPNCERLYDSSLSCRTPGNNQTGQKRTGQSEVSMTYCKECLSKQRKINEFKEEIVSLKTKLCYQQRTAKEGFFGSSTPYSKIPVKPNSNRLSAGENEKDSISSPAQTLSQM